LPKKIFVVDELPRNAMGKVQKNLRREHGVAGCEHRSTGLNKGAIAELLIIV
jgi:acyl-coenzyme A synthetase/AMP-(fatty) acid ligase